MAGVPRGRVLLLRHINTRWQRKWLFLELRILGRVHEYLYRGAQPKEEGIEQLKKLGIDTIVDLRGERHGLMEKATRACGVAGNAAGEHSRDWLDGATG